VSYNALQLADIYLDRLAVFSAKIIGHKHDLNRAVAFPPDSASPSLQVAVPNINHREKKETPDELSNSCQK
jgi:hypothetical protein